MDDWMDDWMNVSPDPRNIKPGFALGRCNPCEYAKVCNAQDGWTFLACTHEPHHGRWVAEIKDCPKGGDGDG